ncbi:MAG: permease [Chloroflexi bacterium]|nr:permease [Chloroflexota bacterium]
MDAHSTSHTEWDKSGNETMRHAGRSLWFPILVFTVLFGLLFQYRILSLLKRFGMNVSPLGTRFPVTFDFQTAPVWLSPFYQTLDYLNTVWFTTFLGLFIAGAIAAFLPAAINRWLKGNGLREHFAGAVLGLPNMFCTCCAAGTVAGFKKAGAGLGPSLAFFVASPALNIVVLILAFELLPLKLALARLVLGVAAAVLVTYLVSRLAPPQPTVSARATGTAATPAATPVNWMRYSREIARNVVPLLVLGIFVVSVFKTLVPFDMIARNFGDGFLPTVLASAVGTVLMIPTFSEVVWVKEFVGHGMGTGPATALLITLPAVSLPSLWVLGRVFRSYRLATYLGAFVAALGVIGGLLFSIL